MIYGSHADFMAWLAANDYELSASSGSSMGMLTRGSEYVDAMYGARFSGMKASFDQDREWPRIGAMTLQGQAVPSDAVPRAVIVAAYRAAYAEDQGVKLSRAYDPSGADAQVKREKVDVIETEYFQAPSSAAASAPVVAGLDGLLAAFLRVEGAGIFMGVVGR